MNAVLEHPPLIRAAPVTQTGPRCVVGDFETQAAIMLGFTELERVFPEVMIGLVRELSGRIPIVGIVEGEEQRRLVVTRLCDAGVGADHIQFVRLPVQAMWVRDYGPQFVRQADGGVVVLDAEYFSHRPDCDRIPEDLASLFKVPMLRVPGCVEGGNLLSNGQGLCLTTTALIERNLEHGRTDADVGYILNRYYGFTKALALEQLKCEMSGHVDMFATFTSPDTVVVGRYDPRVDPVNADILDRNAARLRRIETPAGRLKVERIPMPTNAGGIWRTYTNVIYANGTLLVPVYGRHDEATRDEALATYARLLPGWDIRTVDASRLIHHRGALRCVSINVPWLEHLFEEAGHRPRRAA